MAIEAVFCGSESYIPGPKPSPVKQSLDLNQKELDILAKYKRDDRPVAQIIKEINNRKALRKPLAEGQTDAFSQKLFDGQVHEFANVMQAWDDPQDSELLKLLGQPLPMMEIIRRVNAVNMTKFHVGFRTEKEINARVQFLLEYPREG